MTGKIIMFKEKEVEMSFEEIVIEFENMVKKFSKDCVSALGKYQDNNFDEDDYFQEGMVELYKAYEKYDSSKGVCFSTYLFKCLNNALIGIGRRMSTESRKADHKHLRLNYHAQGHDDLETKEDFCSVLAGKEDVYFNEEHALEKFLKKKLTNDDRIILAVAFKKGSYKYKGAQKVSIDYAVDFFAEDIDGEIMNKKELAKLLGISKPTLNKRIEAVLHKTKLLINQYYLLEA